MNLTSGSLIAVILKTSGTSGASYIVVHPGSDWNNEAGVYRRYGVILESTP